MDGGLWYELRHECWLAQRRGQVYLHLLVLPPGHVTLQVISSIRHQLADDSVKVKFQAEVHTCTHHPVLTAWLAGRDAANFQSSKYHCFPTGPSLEGTLH